MKYNNGTFIAYYRFRAGLLSELLIRPAVTVPRSSVFKGTITPTADEEALTGFMSDIINIVTDNQLIPVTAIAAEEIVAPLSAFMLNGISDTESNQQSAGLTIHLGIADSGVNSGLGVLMLTYDFNNVKSYIEVPIEE